MAWASVCTSWRSVSSFVLQRHKSESTDAAQLARAVELMPTQKFKLIQWLSGSWFQVQLEVQHFNLRDFQVVKSQASWAASGWGGQDCQAARRRDSDSEVCWSSGSGASGSSCQWPCPGPRASPVTVQVTLLGVTRLCHACVVRVHWHSGCLCTGSSGLAHWAQPASGSESSGRLGCAI